MNPELQQLKDIHLPPAVNMWPLAPGWIALFVILLVGSIYFIYALIKQRRKKHTIKFALTKLDKLEGLLLDNPDNINVAAEISTLLRRTALYYFPRENIAGLSGQHWLKFLNQSGETTHFSEETGRLLTEVPYQKESTRDLTPLFAITRAWLARINQTKAK